MNCCRTCFDFLFFLFIDFVIIVNTTLISNWRAGQGHDRGVGHPGVGKGPWPRDGSADAHGLRSGDRHLPPERVCVNT